VCFRDDFQEVEGFAAEEFRPEGEDAESGDGEVEDGDQVEVAGRAFKAAGLHLPVASDVGMPIGKMRGALRGMCMEVIPRVYGIDRDQRGPVEPLSGKGFGGGTGPVGKAKKEVAKGGKVELAGETGSMPTSGVADPPKTDRGKAGKKGRECYLHGSFLCDMLPGQTLRMQQGHGTLTGMAAIIPEDGEDDDADLRLHT